MFYKIGVRKTSAKFTGKHLRQSIFFNKVAGLLYPLKTENLWFSDVFKG